MDVQKAKDFIVKNARPVELAMYRCFFENGSKLELINALKPYQNPDGGFGNALGPDNWNPHSTPITTNSALIFLFETGALGEAGKMAEGIAQYLTSGQDFHKESCRWFGSIESNKDYPHAIWWERDENDAIPSWNPTVSLAAFLVCMGERGPWKELVRQAFEELAQTEEKDGDGLKCYMLAWKLLKKYGITDVIDFVRAQEVIQRTVSRVICKETEKYGVEYEPSPSWYFQDDSPFFSAELSPFIQAELEALGRLQQDDGGFDISWQWYTPYEKEFRQAKAWWRPRVTMEKLRFYQRYGG